MTEAEKLTQTGTSPEKRAEMFSGAILARIEPLTLILGGVGTVWASWRWGWRGGVGVAVGAALSWLNFRWLKGGVRGFGNASGVSEQKSREPGEPTANQEAPVPVRVPKSAYFKFIGRYVLLLGGVYVILTRTSLPAISVLLGLFAAGAGVIVAILHETLRSAARQAFGRDSQRRI